MDPRPQMLTPFPIRNDGDYERAVDLVAQLLDAPAGTREAEVDDLHIAPLADGTRTP